MATRAPTISSDSKCPYFYLEPKIVDAATHREVNVVPVPFTGCSGSTVATGGVGALRIPRIVLTHEAALPHEYLFEVVGAYVLDHPV